MTVIFCGIGIIICLTALNYHKITNALRIAYWKRQLNLAKHGEIFAALYENINGFSLSKLSRAKFDAPEYTYGEIEFTTFIALLSQTNINKNSVFYDLGSGSGKAVIACAMVFPVAKSCGIELFKSLHICAQAQQQKLATYAEYQTQAAKIMWLNANFLDQDFSDASIIFVNATAFIGETWEKLNVKFADLNPGVTILTASKKLLAENFTLQRTTYVKMSWGVVMAYIYKNF